MLTLTGLINANSQFHWFIEKDKQSSWGVLNLVCIVSYLFSVVLAPVQDLSCELLNEFVLITLYITLFQCKNIKNI